MDLRDETNQELEARHHVTRNRLNYRIDDNFFPDHREKEAFPPTNLGPHSFPYIAKDIRLASPHGHGQPKVLLGILAHDR